MNFGRYASERMSYLVLHGHHNCLTSEYKMREEGEARIEFIRHGGKPTEETPTRLRLIRILSESEAVSYVAVQEAYDKAMAPARKAFDEAVAPALKAYNEAMAAAWKAHDEAATAAAFDEAVPTAWKAYGEAVATARKAYDEAVAAPRKARDEAETRWHRSVCVADCPWDGETIFPNDRRQGR